ncbi:MAG: hypothetical protein AB7O38_26530, partial [Pirellulaceae bacterium]
VQSGRDAVVAMVLLRLRKLFNLESYLGDLVAVNEGPLAMGVGCRRKVNVKRRQILSRGDRNNRTPACRES